MMNKEDLVTRIRSIASDAIKFPSETRSLLIILADDIEEMTLAKDGARDWLAGLAMQGLLANGDYNPIDAANMAYVYADAMLKKSEVKE